MSVRSGLALAALLVTPIAARAGSAPQGEDALFALHDHRDLQLALRRIATEHPEIAAIVPVGVSRAGRPIEALRLAAGERPPGRPAILVVANLDGPYVYTSGLALEHADRLASGYASEAGIRALLDAVTLYILPRANPDAAESRFARPLAETRASGPGGDDDRDGRNGEDAPSDVDDDGLVAVIRVKDPDGEWMPDPTDARALVRADPKLGQAGIYKLWPEGRDSDKDEKVGEDPELDVIVNRNFPEGWKEHDSAGGAFATDEPETRALCEFVLAHEDIALVVAYGALDNLVEKPKSAKDDAPRQKLLPPEGVLESDADLLAEIGKRYRKITANRAKSEGEDNGSFQAWCQTQRGLWCLAIRPWSIPLEEDKSKREKGADSAGATEAPGAAGAPNTTGAPDAPDTAVKAEDRTAGDADKERAKDDEDKPKPSDDAQRLSWIDAQNESARFVPWKPFRHPELGEVEIGGFAPYATIEPPAREQERIAKVELEFLLTLGSLLPRVRITECTAKNLQGSLWEIEAAIENDSFLPLLSSAERRARSARPARVSLRLPPGATILAGNRQELVDDLRGSGGRRELRWLVHGSAPGSIGVEVQTDRAGTAQAIPEIKR